MKIDLSFSHSYEFRVLDELPTRKKIYYYPGASNYGGSDGLLVELNSFSDDPWVGVFAFGNVSPKGITGIYTLPNPDKLCIVSRGQGYLVSIKSPTDWNKVDLIPVMDVLTILPHGIIVFANYTEIIAYDAFGIKWETGQLAWDGFKITEVTNNYMIGEYSESEKKFKVDLLTGKLVIN